MQRKTIALAVVFCLFIVQSLTAATPFNPASIRQQADQLGTGARVRLKLASGGKLVGSIAAIQDDGLLFAAGQQNTPKLIAYNEVAQLKLASRRYRASGETDALHVRRVVSTLGVGQHVVVNRAGAKALHGHIQSFDSDHFTVLPDHEAAPVQISYSEVRHVEKNLSFGATIVLVILILAAVVVAATVATR